MKPSVNAISARSKHQQLPVKLHQLLTAAEEEGFTDIVSWSSDGRSFRVHHKERFTTEIMPSYFNSTMYKTFQRSLNLWQFRTLLKGPDKGAVRHENFVRGMPELCDEMTRIRVKCKNARSHLKAKKPPTPTEPQQRQQQQPALIVSGDSVLLRRLRQHQRPTPEVSPSSSMLNVDYTSTAAPPAPVTSATPKQASAMYQHSNSQQQYHQGNAAGSVPGPFAAQAPTNHQAPSSPEQQQQQLLLALLGLGPDLQQVQQQQASPPSAQAWSSAPAQAWSSAPAQAPPASAAADNNVSNLTPNILLATLQQLLTVNQTPAPTLPAPTQQNGLESMLLQLLLPFLNANGSNDNSQMPVQSNMMTSQAPAYTDNAATSSQPQVSMEYLQALLAAGQNASSRSAGWK